MKEYTPDYVKCCQFDHYCKLVLYHEAIDYLREMKCRRDREVSLDAVSPADWDKLSIVDRYSCDSFVFSAFGYALHIRDELVAGAFVKLPEQEQQILILHYVATMADTNIGRLMGMSRSAVQRHRTKALNELRKRLEDDGGRKAK
mgnify:CR=1 FL=1